MFSADALTMLPWAVGLSAIALFLAWRAYRNGEYGRAMRWGGWATIVWAVWLVGLMRLAVRIAGAVADWAAGFVFRPSVWIGLVVGVVGVLLVVGGSVWGRRRAPQKQITADEPRRSQKKDEKPAGRPAVADDDDMADIEAILRKHGIE